MLPLASRIFRSHPVSSIGQTQTSKRYPRNSTTRISLILFDIWFDSYITSVPWHPYYNITAWLITTNEQSLKEHQECAGESWINLSWTWDVDFETIDRGDVWGGAGGEGRPSPLYEGALLWLGGYKLSNYRFSDGEWTELLIRRWRLCRMLLWREQGSLFGRMRTRNRSSLEGPSHNFSACV